METRIYTINENFIDENIINSLGRSLKNGGLVAFPTETVYGLGANGLDTNSIKRIFQAKGRPSDNPLILHIDDIKSLEELCIIENELAYTLAERFWPGPLTLVLKRKDIVPDIITAGLDTVGIRMPNNNIALKLIEAAGVPIAAPSANRSGSPSPTRALHVFKDLEGRIESVIDGGETGVGLESTVLDLTQKDPIILRPGATTFEMLRELIPNLKVDQAILDLNEIPKSPGQKYKHYSPKAKLILVYGEEKDIVDFFNKQTAKDIGILASTEICKSLDVDCLELGSRSNLEEVAHNLFSNIRELDETEVKTIYCEVFNTIGIGAALMNRLKKASGGESIYV